MDNFDNFVNFMEKYFLSTWHGFISTCDMIGSNKENILLYVYYSKKCSNTTSQVSLKIRSQMQ